MKVSIKNGVLFIEIPMAKDPQPSKSGKSLMLATTHGFTGTEAKVSGKPVKLSLNAIIGNGE